jgi:hypothetical protein
LFYIKGVYEMEYIALGKRNVIPADEEGMRGESVIGPPYTVYAVSEVKGGVGKPPYFKVTGMNCVSPAMREIPEGSHEYSKLQKLVGRIPENKRTRGVVQRRLFRQPRAESIVDEFIVTSIIHFGELAEDNPR